MAKILIIKKISFSALGETGSWAPGPVDPVLDVGRLVGRAARPAGARRLHRPSPESPTAWWWWRWGDRPAAPAPGGDHADCRQLGRDRLRPGGQQRPRSVLEWVVARKLVLKKRGNARIKIDILSENIMKIEIKLYFYLTKKV
jgi:hypothetical protein